jgi:hypothetical protein
MAGNGNGNGAQKAAAPGNGTQETNTVRLNKGVQQVTAPPQSAVKSAEPLVEQRPNGTPIHATEGFEDAAIFDAAEGERTQVIKIKPMLPGFPESERPSSAAQEMPTTAPPDQGMMNNIMDWAKALGIQENNLMWFTAAGYKVTSGYTNFTEYRNLTYIFDRVFHSADAIEARDPNAASMQRFNAIVELVNAIQNPKFQPYMLFTFKIIFEEDNGMDTEAMKNSFAEFNGFITKWDPSLQPQKLSKIDHVIWALDEMAKRFSEQRTFCVCDEPMSAALAGRKILELIDMNRQMLDEIRKVV